MALSSQARARLEPDAAQIIARYPKSRSALLPLLHLVQSEEGYVSATASSSARSSSGSPPPRSWR